MFIVVAASVAVPDMAAGLMNTDPQEILPTFIKEHMPLWLRILFFGAVLSRSDVHSLGNHARSDHNFRGKRFKKHYPVE